MTEQEDKPLEITSSRVLIPDQMNTKSSIEDAVLFDLYKEILEDLRSDRKEVEGLLSNLTEMVFNENDAQTSTKEAMVNLVKIKTDIADKKSKIAGLMTDIKLKEKSAANIKSNQPTNIHITDKRSIIQTIDNIKKGKNEQKQLEQPK